MNHHYRCLSKDPRVITLRYDSVCSETGKKLKKGDEAVYYPINREVFSMDSQQAYEFKNWQADIQNGNNY